MHRSHITLSTVVAVACLGSIPATAEESGEPSNAQAAQACSASPGAPPGVGAGVAAEAASERGKSAHEAEGRDSPPQPTSCGVGAFPSSDGEGADEEQDEE